MVTGSPLHLRWLTRLRFAAMCGQLGLVLWVHFGMGLELRLGTLLGLIALGAASNVALWWVAKGASQRSEWLVLSVMAFDALLLTALLYVSGGPFNPFSVMYLVQLTLAAVVLRARLTWALFALCVVAFGALFRLEPDGARNAATHAAHMRMHLEGMWLAFTLAAGFIIVFVHRVTRLLAARDAELSAARERASRTERLASLATLSAGAAHELSTPLGTIAVVAKELERALERSHPAAVEDARLIRRQVERCRAVLSQLAADAGAGIGEAPAEVPPARVVEAAVHGLPGAERVTLDVAPDAGALLVPPRATAHALRSVVQNALQASGGAVRVHVSKGRIAVRDDGPGMPPQVLARAGEPFFTTKSPGEGMGLGLFLTRTVLEQSGGSLSLQSRTGQGTVAELCLRVP